MPANFLFYDSASNSLKQGNTAERDQLADYILEIMAAGTYAGTITEGSGTNSIGVFTDTVRQGDVGSGSTNIQSRNFTLYQKLTKTLNSVPPQYVGLAQPSTNSIIIRENQTTLDELADDVINRSLNGGPNSYFLGINPPSDGGTWVDRGSLTDSLANFNTVQSDYRLWHKVLSGNSDSSKRFLKLSASGTLTAFSEQDLTNIISIIEERIISTGIGQYALQQNVPTTGTWVNASTLNDTRRGTTNATYIGSDTYLGGSTPYIGSTPYYGPVTTYTGPSTPYYGPRSTYIGRSIRTRRTFVGSQTYIGPERYIGPGTYFGPAVSNTIETINSYSLWKRIS